MKTMTCKQLGGACDTALQAKSFEEIARVCRQHVAEMFEIKDEAHLKAASEMKELMKTPGAMEEWFANKKKEFDALPQI